MTPAQKTRSNIAVARLVRAYAYSRAHSKLAAWAERKYGDHGSLISGVVRDHFPEQVKVTLRNLARSVADNLARSRQEWRLARRRHNTWMRAKEQVIVQYGRGFYG